MYAIYLGQDILKCHLSKKVIVKLIFTNQELMDAIQTCVTKKIDSRLEG